MIISGLMKMVESSVRIDKYLWAVRMFKTRSQATDACRKGAVEVGGQKAKPSRTVHEGEMIRIRKNQINYQIQVLRITGRRMPAKDVPGYATDMTSPEELEKLSMQKAMYRGTRFKFPGRPTKKDRRMLDRFMNDDNNTES